MKLQELVEKTKKFDDRTLAITLKNGFAIGFEKYKKGEQAIVSRGVNIKDRGDDIKYELLDNYSMPPAPANFNACFLSDDKGTYFTVEAGRLFYDFPKTLKSPIKEIEAERQETYDNIIEPLGIKPVHGRNWAFSLSTIGLTLTYPISMPIYYAYHRIKHGESVAHTPLYFLFTAIPSMFPEAVKELIKPDRKGYKITNKQLVKPTPDSSSLGIELHERNEDEESESLDFFGDGSGDNPYLSLHFPDGLRLCNGHAYYLSLEQKENEEWQKYRDFKRSVKKEDVKELLDSLNF